MRAGHSQDTLPSSVAKEGSLATTPTQGLLPSTGKPSTKSQQCVHQGASRGVSPTRLGASGEGRLGRGWSMPSFRPGPEAADPNHKQPLGRLQVTQKHLLLLASQAVLPSALQSSRCKLLQEVKRVMGTVSLGGRESWPLSITRDPSTFLWSHPVSLQKPSRERGAGHAEAATVCWPQTQELAQKIRKEV